MIILIIIFIISLVVLIKGADLFLVSAERIGLALGLSPFIVGVTIVAIGTSFPELFTSMIATFRGFTEIVPANVIGSNIANILLIVGISAIIGKKISVTKNLIDIDLPLLATGTAVMMIVIIPWGGEGLAKITRLEAIILVITYGAYFLYTIFHKDERHLEGKDDQPEKSKISAKDIILLIIGIIALSLGANYLIDSVVEIATLMGIAVGVISILAVAVGTSLPELMVSVRAALQKKPEVALGNIFGSNIFNSFVVLGLPGIFREIYIDSPTLLIGFPVMLLATLLFVISGISRRIHNWEGIFFLSLYVLFVIKVIENSIG
ncbi:MAG: Inner membrane protein YrbG [Dehalococcoidia bacterium]|nr:Inner membrane protein YrbG [Bacillota bacterium]